MRFTSDHHVMSRADCLKVVFQISLILIFDFFIDRLGRLFLTRRSLYTLLVPPTCLVSASHRRSRHNFLDLKASLSHLTRLQSLLFGEVSKTGPLDVIFLSVEWIGDLSTLLTGAVLIKTLFVFGYCFSPKDGLIDRIFLFVFLPDDASIRNVLSCLRRAPPDFFLRVILAPALILILGIYVYQSGT